MAIAHHPLGEHHQRESGTMLLASAFEMFICINEILSQSSLLWTEQAQLPQSLLIREMCPYKTLPRAFIADQVPFPPQFSAFHPAARGISSRAQHQPYLVHRATGDPCSAVPSKLALPPSHPTHPVNRLTFRETGCPVQLSYVLFLSLIFVGCKSTSLLQPLTFSLMLSFYSWHFHCGVWPQW